MVKKNRLNRIKNFVLFLTLGNEFSGTLVGFLVVLQFFVILKE